MCGSLTSNLGHGLAAREIGIPLASLSKNPENYLESSKTIAFVQHLDYSYVKMLAQDPRLLGGPGRSPVSHENRRGEPCSRRLGGAGKTGSSIVVGRKGGYEPAVVATFRRGTGGAVLCEGVGMCVPAAKYLGRLS
jgi:hypothetical protein